MLNNKAHKAVHCTIDVFNCSIVDPLRTVSGISERCSAGGAVNPLLQPFYANMEEPAHNSFPGP